MSRARFWWVDSQVHATLGVVSVSARSAVFALLLAGCRSPATQIELVLDTDVSLDRRFEVRVVSLAGRVDPAQLESLAQARMLQDVTLVREPGSALLPGSVGVVPTRTSATEPVTVWLRARASATATAPEVRLDRVIAVQFVRGQTGRVRVFLPLRCGDAAVGCTTVSDAQCTVSARCREQGATCGDRGECVMPEIPVEFVDGGGVSDVPSQGLDATTGRTIDAQTDGNDGPDQGFIDAPTDALVDAAPEVLSDANADVVDGAMAIGIPRLISPQSLSDVTHRRPLLRWINSPTNNGASGELCADRACLTRIESFEILGESYQLPRDLPASSPIFWRLRGMIDDATGTEYSPTWLFHTPAVSSANGVSVSSNPHFDVNGDGVDDAMVGVPNAGFGARALSGSITCLRGNRMNAIISNTCLSGSNSLDRLGTAIAAAGDLNGDGFGDFAIAGDTATVNGRNNAGVVRVYYGSAMGFPASAAVELGGSSINERFGYAIATAGDVNGDGYSELLVGTIGAGPGGRNNAGRVGIYHGNAAALSSVPTLVIEGNAAGDQLGASVSSAGDVNGDGYADILIGAPRLGMLAGQATGEARLYLGSASGIDLLSVQSRIGGPLRDSLGMTVVGLGDVNRDGYSDFAFASPESFDTMILAPQPGYVLVFAGSRMGPSLRSAVQLRGMNAQDNFGLAMTARDLNGDGASDIVIGAPQSAPGGRVNAGAVVVYQGAVNGIQVGSPLVMEGTVADSNFGGSLGSFGDYNGDGFNDVLVGSPNFTGMSGVHAGQAQLYLGSRMGLTMPPTVSIFGGNRDEQLGFSVSR